MRKHITSCYSWWDRLLTICRYWWDNGVHHICFHIIKETNLRLKNALSDYFQVLNEYFSLYASQKLFDFKIFNLTILNICIILHVTIFLYYSLGVIVHFYGHYYNCIVKIQLKYFHGQFLFKFNLILICHYEDSLYRYCFVQIL